MYKMLISHNIHHQKVLCPPRQPVPVPKLPKLVHDSEREFTDLKLVLDHLLTDHAELSEHYKY